MKIFYLLFFCALTLNSDLFGQIKSSKPNEANTQLDKLIGTWRLTEFANWDSATSKWKYPYGKSPKGYFTYTKSGIVNINISSETPLNISVDSAKNYNINLMDWSSHFSVGYFGTYTVEFNKSVVTHHVKGGSVPWYIDTDQPRQFIIKGDTLLIGNNKTWKRILVKTE